MISIVVLARNRPDEVANNLPILAAWAAGTGNELIVVDNASTDDTPVRIAAVRESHPEIAFVENRENLGVGGGRNTGFRLAKGDVVLCLDDDSNPDIDLLEDLEALFTAYPEMGILTPQIVHATSGVYQNHRMADPHWVANFHGSCHAFSRKVIDAIGLQDEECTFGGEELDYSVRAHKAGFKTLYHPDYRSLHNSFERTYEEQMQRWTHWVYNYARVLAKNFPGETGERFARNYIQLFTLKFLRAGRKEEAATVRQRGLDGFKKGQAVAEPCPAETLAFYDNPRLLPEFGNASVFQKALLRTPLQFLVPGNLERNRVERRPLR